MIQQIISSLMCLSIIARVTLAVTQAEVDANENEADALLSRFNNLIRDVDPATAANAAARLNGIEVLPDIAENVIIVPEIGSGDGRGDSRERPTRLPVESAVTFRPLQITTTTERPQEGFIDPCGLTTDPRKCCKSELPFLIEDITVVKSQSCRKTRIVRVEGSLDLSKLGTPGCSVFNVAFDPQCLFRTRIAFVDDVCTFTEIQGQSTPQCCPTELKTCCLGFIYVQEQSIPISTGSSIQLKEQCATLDEFKKIIAELEKARSAQTAPK